MSYPIEKKVIHAGQKYIPIVDGTKVQFHFQAWKLGKERVLLDDSRCIGLKEPMELVFGHKFKMDVWETLLKYMSVGEVASFKVEKELVFNYPLISKCLRERGQETKVKHTCTMTLQTEGIGYPDLDELIANPCDLEFVMELLKVEGNNEYQRELWQMNVEERLELVATLRERGNDMYMSKKYDAAEEAYYEAISICEQLLIRERKGDDEWISLNKIKLPILLNYAQCKLVKGEYYAVIEHCNTVLEHDKDNLKALFRRAKAHVGAWNPDAAEKDFKAIKTLNPSMTSFINNELEIVKKLRKEKEEQDKDALKKLFE